MRPPATAGRADRRRRRPTASHRPQLDEIAQGRSRVWQSNRSAARECACRGGRSPSRSRAGRSRLRRRRRSRSAGESARRARCPPARAAPQCRRRSRRCSRRSSPRRPQATTGSTRSSTTATGCSRGSTGGTLHAVRRATASDWTTRRSPASRATSRSCRCGSAWIDGEVVVLDAQGRSRFQALQNALSAAHAGQCSFFAFDLPYVDGLRPARRAAGRAQGAAARGGRRWRRRASASVPRCAGDGAEFFRQACSLQPRGRRLQAGRLALRGRRAHARLGQGEVHDAGRRW